MPDVTPEHWQRVAQVYQEAKDSAPSERGAFLDRVCGDDADLRHEVESLLAQGLRESPLDRPLWEQPSGARLAVGTELGPYRVEALLGIGGMGEVYRAHDTNLGRGVALKVLPTMYADDPERLARFRREAEVLASLNHPHIAMIHGLEICTVETGAEPSTLRALVLELVEGETLEERIRRGPLPIEEAMAIASQIAAAVEAAHQLGVIHRDLKPSNIKIRDDGAVKVLDFGLAKLTEPREVDRLEAVGPPPSVTTAMQPTSGHGFVFGSPPYMAPEQARGLPADERSDIWAFGCVLYEMLTGRRAFGGQGASDTLAAVLRAEPDWNALPATTPQPLRRLLRRALQKHRARRLADIADARLEIEEAQTPEGATPAVRSRFVPAVAVAAAVFAAGVIVALFLFKPSNSRQQMRLDLSVPATTDPASLAISPDGMRVVYVAGDAGERRLWVHSLEEGTARPIEGTEGARSPFWSPDGQSIGFTADNVLKRFDLAGASVRTVGTGLPGGDATVNAAGVILTQGGTGPIRRIDPDSTEAVAATRVEPAGAGHRAPHFLPDDRHFVFYAAGASRGLYVGELDTLDATHLGDADSGAVYAASGHLLFVRQGTLIAQPFDLNRVELRGEPIRIAEQVAVGLLGTPAVAASRSGPVVYRTTRGDNRSQFVWHDRSGTQLQSIGEPLLNTRSFAMSPDADRLAVQMAVDGNNDIWLLETARGILNRFTSGAGLDNAPIWSHDGTRIAYQTSRGKDRAIVVRPVDGSEDEEVLVSSPESKLPRDWSSDGSHILYLTAGRAGPDLWAVPVTGNRKPFPIADSDFAEAGGQFSPDGKWVAFASSESGRYEIYIQPFPRGQRIRISTSGGAQVRWNRNGRELFYVALDERLMSVAIRLDSAKRAVEHVGHPVALFATRIGRPDQEAGLPTQYVVAPDGRRFLMRTVLDPITTSPLTLLLNWQPSR